MTGVREGRRPRNFVLRFLREYPGTALFLCSYVVLFVAMTLFQSGLTTGDKLITSLGISGQTLREFGALDVPGTVTRQEYSRLLTATLLHASVWHLFFNAFALIQLGVVIESWFGAGILIVLHVIFGLVGNLTSLAYHLEGGRFLQVGASGSLFGLMLFLAMVAAHDHGAEARKLLLIMLFWAALGLGIGVWVGADNAAHVGGAIAGVFVGNFELLIRREVLPKKLRQVFGILAGLVLIVSFADLYHRQRVFRLSESKPLFTQGTKLLEIDQLMKLVLDASPSDPASPQSKVRRQNAIDRLTAVAREGNDPEFAYLVEQIRGRVRHDADEKNSKPDNRQELLQLRARFERWRLKATGGRIEFRLPIVTPSEP